jgi:hypothetical protein
MRKGSSRWALLGLALLAPAQARADEAALMDRIEQLELRIDDLEADKARSASGASGGGWEKRVRLSGSANTGFYGGNLEPFAFDDAFKVWDLRLFVDADLGRAVQLGETEVFRNIAFFFEWNLVRLNELENDVGELYVDFQGFLEQDWLNFQVGRFQIPVGEAYLRYSRGYSQNPFVTNPVGGPWWWDEGIRFYGSADGGRYGYVASVTNGDTPFNYTTGSGHQGTLKLFWRPLEWLYMSVSGLRSGELGGDEGPASASLWLGESWGRVFGSSTTVPSFQDGVIVPPGPATFHDSWLAAADTVIELEDKFRMWLAYGHSQLDSDAPGYDRSLHYWIAELILKGAWLTEDLRPFYLGLRANALDTFDDGDGYALDARLRSTLGYNIESLTAYSLVLGWNLTSNVRLRAEYTRLDIDLVRGVTDAIRHAGSDADLYGVEVGVAF